MIQAASPAICSAQDGIMDAAITTVVNDMMCSTMCPCPAEAAQIYPESIDDRKLVFSNEGKTFDTFQQCWTNVLVDSEIYSESFISTVDEYMGVMFEMEHFESCSGVCAPGNFWFTQPVTLAGP